VPFSDPIADGPVISAPRSAPALGTTLSRILELCASLRREEARRSSCSLFQPISSSRRGGLRGARAASGVEGVLVTDLPPRRVRPARRARGASVDRIGLVAPTSTGARIDSIAAATSGFLYYISRAG